MPDVLSDLSWLLPGLKELVHFPCAREGGPCEKIYRAPMEVSNIVMHLNDLHQWDRVDIADWLDTLDVDLTFPDEPPAAPRPVLPGPTLVFSSMPSVSIDFFSIDPGPWIALGKSALKSSYSIGKFSGAWSVNMWNIYHAKPKPPVWIDEVPTNEQVLIYNAIHATDDEPVNYTSGWFAEAFSDLDAEPRHAFKKKFEYNPLVFEWEHGPEPLVKGDTWSEKFGYQPTREKRKKK